MVEIPSLLLPAKAAENDTGLENGGDAAWTDSDDERVVISLASNPRLRKLRVAESEDLIDGKEYVKRLRRQFERLNPPPEWVKPTAVRKLSHRRERQNLGDSDGTESVTSENEMSLDDEELSTQPLAKLLQNAGSLMPSSSTSTQKKRKLRPEIIDIHRTKDVGMSQPVCRLVQSGSHPFTDSACT